MIRIEIEGHDASHIRAQLQDLLRLYPSEITEKFSVKTAMVRVAEHAVDGHHVAPAGEVVSIGAIAGTDDACHAALGETGDSFSDPLPPVVKVSTLPNLAAAEAAEPKKETRGRPRGSKNKTAQPAVAENTGSGPAVEQTPAAGIVQSDAGAATAAVADAPAAQPGENPRVVVVHNAPSAADMRHALQTMAEKLGQDAGQNKAREILAQFGIRKVKDVTEDQHAKIIELANAEIAKAA